MRKSSQLNSRALMATTLHQNINHIAIDGQPQILMLSLNRNKHLFDAPRIA